MASPLRIATYFDPIPSHGAVRHALEGNVARPYLVMHAHDAGRVPYGSIAFRSGMDETVSDFRRSQHRVHICCEQTIQQFGEPPCSIRAMLLDFFVDVVVSYIRLISAIRNICPAYLRKYLEIIPMFE